MSTFVGTPGLGYPLLLCLGKSLVAILDYVQTAGPLRSGALFTRQRSPDPSPGWERSGSTTCSGRSMRSARTAGGSGPLVEDRTPAEPRTPRGVPDPWYSNRTPH